MARFDFSRISVLVVDDNAHMRHLVRAILEACRFGRVLEAADGSAGLGMLASGGIDLAITDWMMAPMDGYEFVRQVRRGPNSPDPLLPIIMLTGHSERRRVRAARDVGATEFLAKPVTGEALLQRISAVIERPRTFVRAPGYVGPDRRRQDGSFSGDERRGSGRPGTSSLTAAAVDSVLAPMNGNLE